MRGDDVGGQRKQRVFGSLIVGHQDFLRLEQRPVQSSGCTPGGIKRAIGPTQQ
jgi:hypothetical protein